MIKSRLGLLLGATAIVLSISPEARKTVRKWAVKGTETVLDLTDMAKDAGAAARHRLQSAMASAQETTPSKKD